MKILDKIKGLFRKEEVEEDELEELDEVVEKAKKVSKSDLDEIDPWKEFKSICKEVGAEPSEVTYKLAWSYIEETGGVEEDPITMAKEVLGTVKEVDEILDTITEPSSVKKLRKYKDTFKEVKEFKDVVEDLNTKKLTPQDVVMILSKFMKQ